MENLKKDVEMKDEEVKKGDTEAKKAVEEAPADPFYGKYLIINNRNIELKKQMVLLEKAAKEKDFKMVATLTK